jgi:hypothetical protein
MKRRDFIRHLEKHNCVLKREGGNHSVFMQQQSKKLSAVPRHNEINDFLAIKICKDLDIPKP